MYWYVLQCVSWLIFIDRDRRPWSSMVQYCTLPSSLESGLWMIQDYCIFPYPTGYCTVDTVGTGQYSISWYTADVDSVQHETWNARTVLLLKIVHVCVLIILWLTKCADRQRKHHLLQISLYCIVCTVHEYSTVQYVVVDKTKTVYSTFHAFPQEMQFEYFSSTALASHVKVRYSTGVEHYFWASRLRQVIKRWVGWADSFFAVQ